LGELGQRAIICKVPCDPFDTFALFLFPARKRTDTIRIVFVLRQRIGRTSTIQ
jgi:hypothetical protein